MQSCPTSTIVVGYGNYLRANERNGCYTAHISQLSVKRSALQVPAIPNDNFIQIDKAGMQCELITPIHSEGHHSLKGATQYHPRPEAQHQPISGPVSRHRHSGQHQ
jgi:hypothetical protein